MALWATVPRALAAFHSNGARSSWRYLASQPPMASTACLDRNSGGSRNARRSGRAGWRARGAAAAQVGLEPGRSAGRGRSRSRICCWAGFSASVDMPATAARLGRARHAMVVRQPMWAVSAGEGVARAVQSRPSASATAWWVTAPARRVHTRRRARRLGVAAAASESAVASSIR